MGTTVSVNFNNLGRDLVKLGPDLKNAAINGIGVWATKVQKRARNEHVYKKRTGVLRSATQRGKVKDGYSVSNNDAIAPYAEYVVRATNDDYIENASDCEEMTLTDVIQSEVNKVIRSFNNG